MATCRVIALVQHSRGQQPCIFIGTKLKDVPTKAVGKGSIHTGLVLGLQNGPRQQGGRDVMLKRSGV